MKIICVGRNYALHAQELNNEVPESPVIFLKPETAITDLRTGFFLPDFSQDVHHEAELVVRINKNGKNIQEKFAHKYYDQITVGIDFTARDLQAQLKAKGLPWELSKGFDGSASVGKFLDVSDLNLSAGIDFSLTVNGQQRQKGNSREMLFSIDQIISYVSQFYTLKLGDLIYTGTPAGVSKVSHGDVIEAFINDFHCLKVLVK